MSVFENIELLAKAWEAGSYNATPDTLIQGAAVQKEDLSPVMQVVTYEDKALKLQKELSVENCKSTTIQFNRQLSYGTRGGSAVGEGMVGQEQTSDILRVVIPMSYYAEIRKATVQAEIVDTFDGVGAKDRQAADAALRLAGDIEMDLFRGQADFSNLGVFDGNPFMVPKLFNMHGLDLQVRQSDSQKQAQDLMFNAFGGSTSVVIPVGAALDQGPVEDAAVRSAMNWGNANKLYLDPLTLAAYNKIGFNKERIPLGGAAVSSTGSGLRVQVTSNGEITLEASPFLRGRTAPDPANSNASAPTHALASATVGGTVTTFVAGEIYTYNVTTVNELGESIASASSTVTIAATGDVVNVTITPPGSNFRYFRVYRSAANASSTAFIGAVIAAPTGNTTFRDMNNKVPGFVTGFLVQSNTMAIKQMAPFTRLKMPMNQLAYPEAYYRFCGLAVYKPRMNVLLDNLVG